MLAASPTSLTLNQTGPASFAVTESGYSGSFTVVSDNTLAVTVSTPVTANGSGVTTINITAVGAGTADITVTDTNSMHVIVPVTVTTTPITIQAKRRGH
jgi:hypothetical protein